MCIRDRWICAVCSDDGFEEGELGFVTPCPINGIQLYPITGSVDCQQGITNSIGSSPSLFASGTIIQGGAVSIAANDLTINIGQLPGNGLPATPLIFHYVSDTTLDDGALSNCPL